MSSCSIFILVSEEESVSAVSSERASAQEDDEDGGPDHDAGQEPHQDDPDKGEDTGANQRDPDYPPSLLEVAERPLPKLLEAEEVACIPPCCSLS